MSRAIVVVPCYNEANRLDAVRFQEFSASHPAIDFLFLNDGSTDGTLGVLERLHAVDPARFRFVHLSRNSGKAEAVRRGMLAALEEAPEYVGFWDADLATPLDEIPHFCRVLDEHPTLGMVIGSRLRLLGHRIDRRPLRHWLGRLFANMAGILLGVGIYDTQCGAKLFRANRTCAALFAEPFRARWIFDVEMFARLVAASRRFGGPGLEHLVYEYPLDCWRDVAGSKLRPHDFVWSLAELVRIYWTYLRPGFASPAVTARLAGAGHLPEATVPGPQVASPAKSGAPVPAPTQRRAA
jgi:glycosyltransferase involved in cell wall biosynthesis